MDKFPDSNLAQGGQKPKPMENQKRGSVRERKREQDNVSYREQAWEREKKQENEGERKKQENAREQ